MPVNEQNPVIETIAAMKLVGVGTSMTRAQDSTAALWQALMPKRHQIGNRIPDRYISMRVHPKPGMSIEELFAPETAFEKWAAVEVTEFGVIPEGLEQYVLGAGLYAMFLHRGPASEFPRTMGYIFGEWLPLSRFEFDDREQFEVLPENWNPEDEAAEEQVYIPIRERSDV